MTVKNVVFNGDAPWLAKLIGYLGLGGGLAAYLVYWLTTSVDGKLTSVESAIKTHNNQTIEEGSRSEERGRNFLRTLDHICANTAPDQEALDRCYGADHEH